MAARFQANRSGPCKRRRDITIWPVHNHSITPTISWAEACAAMARIRRSMATRLAGERCLAASRVGRRCAGGVGAGAEIGADGEVGAVAWGTTMLGCAVVCGAGGISE